MKHLNTYYAQLELGNECSYYRIKQINILFEALEIFNLSNNEITKTHQKSPLQYLMDGTFLKERKLEEYDKSFIETITKFGKELGLKEIPKLELRDSDFRKEAFIDTLFSSLLYYRLKVHPFTRENQHLRMGFNFGIYYADYLQMNSAEAIENSLEEIDQTLSLLIDPKQKTLSLSELIDKFNYPDINLSAFDLNYRVDNF